MQVTSGSLDIPDGRTLRYYDTGSGDDGSLMPVFWHHGTPNIGLPPEPLFPAAERLRIRWLGYDRPGYGGSTRRPGRDIASAAEDVARVADALGVDRFGVMGHSGGSPHALACAALLAGRARAAAIGATLAPYSAEDLDWFAGMIASGVVALGAAVQGRDARERLERSGVEYDPEFTAADEAALNGPWNWFGKVVGPAVAGDPGGAIDDDLAYVGPWGFGAAQVSVPVLVMHGARDGIAPVAHARWMAEHLPSAELRVYPEDGHVSVMTHAESALEWLAGRLSR